MSHTAMSPAGASVCINNTRSNNDLHPATGFCPGLQALNYRLSSELYAGLGVHTSSSALELEASKHCTGTCMLLMVIGSSSNFGYSDLSNETILDDPQPSTTCKRNNNASVLFYD